MTYRPIGWSTFDKIGAACLALGVFLGGLWYAFPSSYFIQQVSLAYSQDTRTWTLVREVNDFLAIETETPSGEMVVGHPARWWSEISMVSNDGRECLSGAPQTAFYQIKTNDLVSYQSGEWASPCLDQGPPFYVVTYRRVMLWGWLPLRPSRFVSEVLGSLEGGRFDVSPD